METGSVRAQSLYEKFISRQKCVLLDTMYAILHLAIEIPWIFVVTLHQNTFVTGLYLDKQGALWQYIVEVDAVWHNILCLTPESGCRSLNFKGKSR